MSVWSNIKNFLGGFGVMFVLCVAIVGVGMLVGWLFKSDLAGIITIGVIIVGWGLWGAIQGLRDWLKSSTNEEDEEDSNS